MIVFMLFSPIVEEVLLEFFADKTTNSYQTSKD
jgi:hypothetical protein